MNISIILASLILFISSGMNIANGMEFDKEQDPQKKKTVYINVNYFVAFLGILMGVFLSIAWGFKRVLTF